MLIAKNLVGGGYRIDFVIIAGLILVITGSALLFEEIIDALNPNGVYYQEHCDAEHVRLTKVE